MIAGTVQVYCGIYLLLEVGLDGGLESLGVGTNNLGDLVTALEKKEGGHSADTELLGDIGDLVNVELVEACGGVFVGKLDDLGSNHFTRAAPCCEAVKNHKGLLVVHGGIKVGLGHKVVDALLLFAHFCGV